MPVKTLKYVYVLIMYLIIYKIIYIIILIYIKFIQIICIHAWDKRNAPSFWRIVAERVGENFCFYIIIFVIAFCYWYRMVCRKPLLGFRWKNGVKTMFGCALDITTSPPRCFLCRIKHFSNNLVVEVFYILCVGDDVEFREVVMAQASYYIYFNWK